MNNCDHDLDKCHFYSSVWLFKINSKKKHIIMVIHKFFNYIFYLIVFFSFSFSRSVCRYSVCYFVLFIDLNDSKVLVIIYMEYSLRKHFFSLYRSLFLLGSIDLQKFITRLYSYILKKKESIETMFLHHPSYIAFEKWISNGNTITRN